MRFAKQGTVHPRPRVDGQLTGSHKASELSWFSEFTPLGVKTAQKRTEDRKDGQWCPGHTGPSTLKQQHGLSLSTLRASSPVGFTVYPARILSWVKGFRKL